MSAPPRSGARYGRGVVRGLAVATLAAIALPSAAAAAPIDVNSTADALNANDGLCTLREAVRSANLDTASGPGAGECRAGAGADAIRVPAGNFTLGLTGANENAAATGDLDLTGTVDVTGAGTTPGPTGTTLNGMADRVFDIQAGAAVTISSL